MLLNLVESLNWWTHDFSMPSQYTIQVTLHESIQTNQGKHIISKECKILWLFIKYKENVVARGNNLKFIEFLSFFLVSKVLSVYLCWNDEKRSQVLKTETNKYMKFLKIILQTELLLKYLTQDPRKVVKNHTLSDLRMLAKEAPHMWRIQDIEVLWYLRSQILHFVLTRN